MIPTNVNNSSKTGNQIIIAVVSATDVCNVKQISLENPSNHTVLDCVNTSLYSSSRQKAYIVVISVTIDIDDSSDIGDRTVFPVVAITVVVIAQT